MSRTKHARKPNKDKAAWRNTSAGMAAYAEARREAQAKADATGHDHGIEPNDLFKSWHVFMLPMAQNRCGHELRCEVVHPTRLDKTMIGHGPESTRTEITKVYNGGKS